MNNNAVAWIGVALIIANFFLRQRQLLTPLFGSYSSAQSGSTPPPNAPGSSQGFTPSSAPYYLQSNSPLGARVVG